MRVDGRPRKSTVGSQCFWKGSCALACEIPPSEFDVQANHSHIRSEQSLRCIVQEVSVGSQACAEPANPTAF